MQGFLVEKHLAVCSVELAQSAFCAASCINIACGELQQDSFCQKKSAPYVSFSISIEEGIAGDSCGSRANWSRPRVKAEESGL